MTAYVYQSIALSKGHLTIEMQSLNRKYLEVSCTLGQELSRYESELKKIVGKGVGRGQVTLRVSFSSDDFTPYRVRPNLSFAKELKEAWVEIAREVGAPIGQVELSLFKGEEGLLIYEENSVDDEGIKEELFAAIEAAVEALVKAKECEGRVLQSDIEKRVDRLSALIEEIDEKSPGATVRYREKLVERLEGLFSASSEIEERLLREVCLYAEKVDITEEITRFRSHIALFKSVTASKESTVGKKLEFILQELLREANTIGSKSSDVAIAHSVVDIKGELEKIREQIQNVE